MKPLLLLFILTIFTGCKTEPEPDTIDNAMAIEQKKLQDKFERQLPSYDTLNGK